MILIAANIVLIDSAILLGSVLNGAPAKRCGWNLLYI